MTRTASMARSLAIVLAGGKGSRMDVLTRERAKPALPLAGGMQLIDVPMSNLRHSGVEDVWLVVQYQARMLEDFASNGRPWDLDRTTGGFRVVPPQQGESEGRDGFAEGNADQLLRLRDEIAESGAEEVLVLSADHLYLLDLREVMATHRRKEAECTIVTCDLGPDRGPREAPHLTTVESNRLGRITATASKPDRPNTFVVATEVFVYRTTALLEELDRLLRSRHTDEVEDAAEDMLPRFVERGRCFEHRMEGYWRDLGRPSTYLEAHRDLAGDDVGILGRTDWPILTRVGHSAPPRLHTTARFDQALVGAGCDIRGEVTRSVLGPRVRVAEGARVSDSVLLGDIVVEAGAVVEWSVLDHGVSVGAGARVGEPPEDSDAVEDEEVALVGADSVIAPGVMLGRGARLEPGTAAD